MNALQLHSPGQLALARLPMPQPGPRDVLIRTAAASICTSDLHDIDHNPFSIRLPRVLGHEGAGVVVARGTEVDDLSEGVAVAAHPVVPCGECVECRRGLTQHCQRVGHLGADRDGCFAEYFVQRADRLRVLPGSLDPAVGALLEPLCVSLQAIARAGDLAGKCVLIAGDGPFGILIARLALRTARRVILAGHNPFRLGQVREVIPILNGDLGTVRQAAEGGVDVAILAVSSAEAAHLCLAALRPRGRLVIFSALGKAVPIDLQTLHLRELEMVGACNDDERLDEAVAQLGDPTLALNGLLTHRVPFAEWPRAFALARERHGEALKVALTFPEA